MEIARVSGPCQPLEGALNRILKNEKEFIKKNILSLRIVIVSYLSSQHGLF